MGQGAGLPPPTEVRVGLPALAEALWARGVRRVLVLTGPSRRHLEALQPMLAGRKSSVFDGARVHVPEQTVAAADAIARQLSPDLLLSVGGGAATGLGKLLRLSHDAAFFVVPTTFSGSEMTAIWGRTEGGQKHTGRDPRVRPDLVIHDPVMVADMPQALAVRSALNALAHPLSALSTGRLAAPLQALSIEAAARVWSPLGELSGRPDSVDARFMLLRGAALCGRVIDCAPLGVHHRVAHLLGARFGLDHGAVHGVLLPHSVGLLRRDTQTWSELVAALGCDAPGPALTQVLHAAGCATSLSALGLSGADLEGCREGLLGLGDDAWELAWAALPGSGTA